MFKDKNKDDKTCHMEDCGKPMFEIKGFFFCEVCDMVKAPA